MLVNVGYVAVLSCRSEPLPPSNSGPASPRS
jgi:hypothetical protein